MLRHSCGKAATLGSRRPERLFLERPIRPHIQSAVCTLIELFHFLLVISHYYQIMFSTSARGSVLLARLILLAIVALPTSGSTISLSGTWRFALDPQDAGLQEAWFQNRLSGHIKLPGSLPGQGVGESITTNTPWIGTVVDRSFFTAPEFALYRKAGHIKVPFWLQPQTYYAGPAWYQREIEVPKSWSNESVRLILERPHWETRVWLDGQSVGTNLSLSTAHEYHLGLVTPGRHSLTVRVDNRLVLDVGRDSHSVSDHTQGNWNGIVGRVELESRPLVAIEDLQIYPNAASGQVTVRGQIRNLTGRASEATLSLVATPTTSDPAQDHGQSATRSSSQGESLCPVTITTNILTSFACDLTLRDPRLWDEFRPQLYLLAVTLESPHGGKHARALRFGFRDFRARGTQFTINSQLTFIRGTLECCIFPKTGHPPTEIESWRRILRIAKAHGLNNLRFHSWCPPEAAFAAADEIGFYYHVECASWANASTTLGDGKPVDRWIYDETERILRAYGNHPSFVMLLYGNEPGGDHHKDYLSRWVTHFRNADPRRLYSAGAGWPQLPENEFHVTPDPRIQSWGGGLKSRINAAAPETLTDYRDYVTARAVPVISHEIGEWCVYPNFDEMKKYTGYLKPKNFEIFRDTLEAHGMAALARPFLHASGKLQALCYKEEIESALRTPGMGGFQLLDLHDFPGQGTALVGVLDPFWEEKGYVTAEEFHRFSGPTVPLARLSKRVFTPEETPSFRVEVAHYGPEPLRNISLGYKLVADDGTTYLEGQSTALNLPLGQSGPLQEWRPDLSRLPAPARYKFKVKLSSRGLLGYHPARPGEGKPDSAIAENDWDIWIYPSHLPVVPASDITVVRELTPEAYAQLASGGKVLWLLPPGNVAPDPKLGKVELGFSSIFWNTAWTRRQPPHTLGILCNPKHPLFAEFPTDSHTNWQWWYLIHRANPMILDGFSAKLQPTVQVIDDWVTARKLALAFEAKVGSGRLFVCSIDLMSDSPNELVVRQFRHSLLQYMKSDRFRPTVAVRPEQLRILSAR